MVWLLANRLQEMNCPSMVICMRKALWRTVMYLEKLCFRRQSSRAACMLPNLFVSSNPVFCKPTHAQRIL